MKKIIVAFVGLAFITSCKRDWNCKCTFAVTGEEAIIQIKNKRKKRAENTCETLFLPSDATCKLQ